MLKLSSFCTSNTLSLHKSTSVRVLQRYRTNKMDGWIERWLVDKKMIDDREIDIDIDIDR
jgi:hypothetical protein